MTPPDPRCPSCGKKPDECDCVMDPVDMQENDRLRAENEKLRAALQYYADEGWPGHGKRARAALSEGDADAIQDAIDHPNAPDGPTQGETHK